jgi:hypothetical protein
MKEDTRTEEQRIYGAVERGHPHIDDDVNKSAFDAAPTQHLQIGCLLCSR